MSTNPTRPARAVTRAAEPHLYSIAASQRKERAADVPAAPDESAWQVLGPETHYTWQLVSERMRGLDEAHVGEYMWLLQRCGIIQRAEPPSRPEPLPLGILYRRGTAYYILTGRGEVILRQAPRPSSPFIGYSIEQLGAFIDEYRAAHAGEAWTLEPPPRRRGGA